MNWRAWAASIVLHSALVALLLSLTTVNPSPDRPARWEVQIAPATPPELPATPTPPATATEVPAQPPLQPPVVPIAQSVPALSAQRPLLPPIAAIKRPSKRTAPPQLKQPPRPIPEKPVATLRKPSASPPAVTTKATPRPSQQQAASSFLETPSRPTPQEVLDSARTAFTETQAISSGRRAEIGHRTDQSPARNAAPPAKPNPKPTADWHAVLRTKLREMRVYPPIARRLGQEGIVTLLIEVNANGNLRGLTVRQSSGHPVLDQAAQQLAHNAIAALRGQLSPPGESRVEIPIAYRLEH
ncbi:MAG: TonB family protein [Candidatus Contendobacter sp.]